MNVPKRYWYSLFDPLIKCLKKDKLFSYQRYVGLFNLTFFTVQVLTTHDKGAFLSFQELHRNTNASFPD